MPDSISFDLKQLIRVCLNDPDLRAEVTAALDEGPIAVRTPCVHVADGERVFAATVRSNRDKEPGEPGFVSRDPLGWASGRLSEIVRTEPDASTISAESMRDRIKPRP
jgi:hypothetical protein